MLRSLAICVSEEMFISLSCAMSMVGAPSGRSEATNFLLIGGVFSMRNFPLVLRTSQNLWPYESSPRSDLFQETLQPRTELSPLCLGFEHSSGAPAAIDYEKFYRPS